MLRLRRPGHQLAVEQQPVARQLVEQPCRIGRGADALEERRFELDVVEEAAAGARVADTEALVDDAEAPASNALVATDDHDRARAHVLLLADHVRHAFVAVVRERLRGML